MHFCPKCGSILLPKGTEKKNRLICSNCGYRSREKKSVVIKEKVKEHEKIPVIAKKLETLPQVRMVCEKCGNKKAYYWLMQTRAADEAETRFFECTKCKYRWREYS